MSTTIFKIISGRNRTSERIKRGLIQVKFQRTEILDCYLLQTEYLTDSRGYFRELYRRDVFEEMGVSLSFVQENESYSSKRLTLRGLHLQQKPHDQWKLVRVSKGSVLDVVVDVRPESETYLKSVQLELNENSGNQILVPKGCLHGFLTLETNTVVTYAVSEVYVPESEVSVRFDDPFLAINWGYEHDQLVLSEKDRNAPDFQFSLPEFIKKDKK